MRIISGKFKGRRITPNKNFKARPTTDFAKESLFNIIHNNFEFTGLSLLDLFSGTGSISYEFYSRGCENITIVEKDYKNLSFIKNTFAELGWNDFVAINKNVFSFLKNKVNKYDVIFADPPYDLDEAETIPNTVFEKEMLKPDGWLILEHSNQRNFDAHPNFSQKRSYGSVNFSIFENKIWLRAMSGLLSVLYEQIDDITVVGLEI